MYDYLDCVRVDAHGVIVRRPLPLIDQKDIPRAHIRGQDASRLATAANYARFTIPRTFPEAGIAWYIDSDALPLADLAGPEFTRFKRSGAAVQAVGRLGTIAAEFNPAVLPMYQARYRQALNLGAPSWNAGVWLSDFSQWPKLEVEADAVHWVMKSNEFAAKGLGRLWKLNTQPIMYLIFHTAAKARAQMLTELWNCESYRHAYNAAAPRGCKVMHWNGSAKPWQATSKGHRLWTSYLPRHSHNECKDILSGKRKYIRQRQAVEAPAETLTFGSDVPVPLFFPPDGEDDDLLPLGPKAVAALGAVSNAAAETTGADPGDAAGGHQQANSVATGGDKEPVVEDTNGENQPLESPENGPAEKQADEDGEAPASMPAGA